MNKQKLLSCVLFAAITTLTTLSLSAATPKAWEVKLRAAHLSMANDSNPFSALDIDFPSGALSVSDKWIPEIDVAYAFTENLVMEVVLTIPQTHSVYLAGVGKIGTLEQLPPTFSLIYEIPMEGGFTPYVSGGLNFTWITDKSLNVAGIELDLEDYSLGLALGGGFRYPINDKWTIDCSAKWIQIDSNVTVDGAKLTNAQLDPLVLSFGAAYRF